MTLTAPGCGMGEILVDDVRSKLELIPTVEEADVDWCSTPVEPDHDVRSRQAGNRNALRQLQPEWGASMTFVTFCDFRHGFKGRNAAPAA